MLLEGPHVLRVTLSVRLWVLRVAGSGVAEQAGVDEFPEYV